SAELTLRLVTGRTSGFLFVRPCCGVVPIRATTVALDFHIVNCQDRSMNDPETPSQVFARRVRKIRAARGWNQRDLAKRLELLGYPLDAVTIAKIERAGREEGEVKSRHKPRRVTIDELFAFAAALGVSPIALLLPAVEGEAQDLPDIRISVAPTVTLEADFVVPWFFGAGALDEGSVPFYQDAANYPPFSQTEEPLGETVRR